MFWFFYYLTVEGRQALRARAEVYRASGDIIRARRKYWVRRQLLCDNGRLRLHTSSSHIIAHVAHLPVKCESYNMCDCVFRL